jgi:hypothetical protein
MAGQAELPHGFNLLAGEGLKREMFSCIEMLIVH